MKLFCAAIFCMLSNACLAHEVSAHANQAAGLHGNPTYITSTHHVKFINQTNIEQQYWYNFSLCVDESLYCTSVYEPMIVPPNETRTVDQTLFVQQVFGYAAHHMSKAKTAIRGEGATETVSYNDITIN